jgi:ApbE superfamily uncharacterized protein (UPF0280 family)
MHLIRFRLQRGETRLLVQCDADVSVAVREGVFAAREELLSHMDRFPEFRSSLEPLETPKGDLPGFVTEMYEASQVAGVGPFASVAGAFAKVAAEAAVDAGAGLVLVENGGDLCAFGEGPFRVGLYAGDSRLSGKLGIQLRPGDDYAGLCTSSGTVGESLSFGEADAVAAYHGSSPALSDAIATSICNAVRGSDGIERGLERAKEIGRAGVLIIHGDRMGVWGRFPEMIEVGIDSADLLLDPGRHSRA